MKTTILKKFGSKKLHIILAIALAAVILTAGTYAWWSGVLAASSTVPMGGLRLGVTLEDAEAGHYYEPGEEANLKYILDNLHPGQEDMYKTAFVKCDFTAGKVTICSDNNGDWVAPYEIDIDPVTLSAEVSLKSVMDPVTYAWAAWYVDTDTNIYYGLIDPGMAADVDVKIGFSGPNMGNMYQFAQFKLFGDFPYTQMMEGAILDVLGLDVATANLDPVSTTGVILTPPGFSTFSISERDMLLNLLYDRLGI